MKREKNEEVRSLRDELQKMEGRKDYYKNNFSQAEDRANDEEQEYRAEAEAFEKLRKSITFPNMQSRTQEANQIGILLRVFCRCHCRHRHYQHCHLHCYCTC